MAQNEETRAVYDKYGVTPSGSCIQLLIQMPILFALYRVIYNVPAYVKSVKNVFLPLSSAIMNESGFADKMNGSPGPAGEQGDRPPPAGGQGKLHRRQCVLTAARFYRDQRLV